MSDAFQIISFQSHLADAFAELNRAWIERFFTLEPGDLKILSDPESAILARGGQIFFALHGSRAVGTVAAMRASPGRYELAKMAVAPAHQGRGLGQRLGQAVVDFARSAGAETLFLETNSALASAIRLYERLGFRQTVSPSPSRYARSDLYMEMMLRPR